MTVTGSAIGFGATEGEATARFLSRDPVTQTDSRLIPSYQFAYANPIEGADPSGNPLARTHRTRLPETSEATGITVTDR